MNLHYKKGQKCLYSQMLCQEGYCSECIICHSISQDNNYIENQSMPVILKKSESMLVGAKS